MFADFAAILFSFFMTLDSQQYKSSIVYVELPADLTESVLAYGRLIPDAHLTDNGRESTPHITILHGITTNNVSDIEDALTDISPFTVSLSQTSVFHEPEFDVLKIDVIDPDGRLLGIREALSNSLESSSTHGDYQPHITSAYLQPGMGNDHSANDYFKGYRLMIDQVVFGGQDGQRTTIKLNGQPNGDSNLMTNTAAEISTQSRNDLPDSAFLYIDNSATGKDDSGKTVPRSARHFPVHDLAHVRNAIARIPQSDAPGLDDAKKVALQAKARKMLASQENDSSKADDPTSTDVHVDDMTSTTTTQMKNKPKKSKTVHYLNKMMSLMSSKFDQVELAAMVKQARSHAGGMTKAEMAKMRLMMGQDDGESSAGTADIVARSQNDGHLAFQQSNDEGSESLTEKIREVESAFYARYGGGMGYQSEYWCQEVWVDYLIARSNKDGDLYRFYYQSDDKGNITFGAPIEVEVTYTDVKHAHDIADMCALGHRWRLFVEYQFADPPEWMPLLPKPGKYQHPEYGEINITKDRNKNFIKNFDSGVYQSTLPINTEHTPDNEGAYGWIEQLRLNENNSVDARVTWTDRGEEAIKKDRFRYISPEWNDTWVNAIGQKFKDILRGAALTVRPFFKDEFLEPLVASENGELFAIAANAAVSRTTGETVIYFSALPPKNQPATTPDSKENQMPNTTAVIPARAESAVSIEQFTELSNRFAEMEKLTKGQAVQIDALTGYKAQAETQIKELTEANSALVSTARTKRLTDEIKGRVEGGVRWHGDFTQHFSLLEKMVVAWGEDSELVKGYIEQQRVIAKQMAASPLYKEIGSDAGGETSARTATEKIEAMVRKTMTDNPAITYGDALAQVARTNRKLYAEHTGSSVIDVAKRSSQRIEDED